MIIESMKIVQGDDGDVGTNEIGGTYYDNQYDRISKRYFLKNGRRMRIKVNEAHRARG